MVTIIFESHATTSDNEAQLASGWNDVALSKTGEEQARQLGKRRAGQHFDAIFCSDLQRAYKTAELAFGTAFPIIHDKRLRECDYGQMTQASKTEVDAYRERTLSQPFPGGESYQDTSRRMQSFLQDLLKKYDGKTVMVIGHRATQYGLEQWVAGKSLRTVVLDPWQWQPGWTYQLNTIA
jgi:broad specificity phosphatase PhoE